MLGRKDPPTYAPSALPNDGNAFALLTVVGSDARLEGKFDIADSIQIDCEVGGQLKKGKKGTSIKL